MGLNKQIQVDEKKKIQKEREQKFERLGSEEIEEQLIKSVGKKLKRFCFTCYNYLISLTTNRN